MFILVLGQMAALAFTIHPARADTPYVPSPETKLLVDLSVLQSSSNPSDSAAFQKGVLGLVHGYDQSSPFEGRQDRMAEAFRESGLYTDAVVGKMIEEVRDFAKSHPVDGYAGVDSRQAEYQAEILRIIARHPASGLQFSGCSKSRAYKTVGALGIAAGLGIFISVLVDHGSGLEAFFGGDLIVLGMVFLRAHPKC